MSEQAFKDARGQLAFSQSLVDKMKQEQSPQVENMEEQTGIQPETTGTENEQPVENEVQNTIKETLTPFMEEIKSLVSEKDEEPKEVELKIAGEMKPAEEDSK